jgi:hypothetical protein
MQARWAIIATAAIACAGCIPQQLKHNATSVIGTIYDLRTEQVLTNLSASIDDITVVPVHVVITQGSAQVSGTVSPTIKLPHMNFSQATREIDTLGTYQWTDQWQFIPVTAPDDLQRLRSLYGAIVRRTREAARGTSKSVALIGFPIERSTTKPTAPGVAPPPTQDEITTALWSGVSVECKAFLEATPNKVWLYWKNGDPDNLPVPPDAIDLGHYGRNEILTTSRACFDDFILLVQSTTTATQTQAIGLGGSSSVLINP